ncbi:hypothetical protein [Streptomyces sp. NPDC050564]|uniref:hypothetical protein n=1 Tax=Streptomyces sp. NPDC050564 TaxID=3365631 RepID=UPI0037BB9C7C
MEISNAAFHVSRSAARRMACRGRDIIVVRWVPFTPDAPQLERTCLVRTGPGGAQDQM